MKNWKNPEMQMLGVSLNENIAASGGESTYLDIYLEGDPTPYTHYNLDVANGVIVDTQYTYFPKEYDDFPNVHYGTKASYAQVSSCKTNNY